MNLKSICSSIRSTNIHTDEDYRRVLRRQQNIYYVMMIVGGITCVIAAMAEIFQWETALTSYHYGFYSGAGGGLVAGAVVFLLRTRRTMNDPQKLRKARVAATDERTLDISRRALAAAGYVLLISLYLACMIGGLFYPVLLMVLATLVCIFLAAYLISYFIYNKLM